MRPMPEYVKHMNRKFLDLHAKEYPHITFRPRGQTNPKRVQECLPEIDFVCAPIDEITEWRFPSLEELRAFEYHYPNKEKA